MTWTRIYIYDNKCLTASILFVFVVTAVIIKNVESNKTSSGASILDSSTSSLNTNIGSKRKLCK